MDDQFRNVPEVSVLMNCYNGERFISEAIRSVLAQSWQNLELVVWDNRSTDQSRHIVSAFPDPRVVMIEAPEHTTLAQARKLALPHLRGKWIAILDVDDLWRPDKLAKQMALAQQKPDSGFIYCRTGVLQESPDPGPTSVFSREMIRLPEGNIYPQLLRGNYIAIASLLINRHCLTSIGGFSGRYPVMEDYYVTLNLARRFSVAAVQEELCDYRIHGDNASLAGPLDTFEDLNIVRNLFPDPRALVAALRIMARHLKKCLLHRTPPQFREMTRALV